MKTGSLLALLFLLLTSTVFSQNDSIVLINGDHIAGEIKSMSRGVLTFKTDYSDSDFKIEWDGIAEIYGVNFFLFTLSNGERYTGSFRTAGADSIIIREPLVEINTTPENIVYVKSVDQDFWSRAYASIDLGLSVTKANNLRQLNTRANLGYVADFWSVDASLSTLFSEQNEIDATRRTDASGTFSYFLPKDWYIPATISFLSNTEQKLDLRTSARLGFGKYVIHTNRSYWGFSLGASYNNEKYSTDAEHRKSWEGYLGTELNLYDIGDLNLLTTAIIYPGLTDTERFRSDFRFDVKYDLPLDFYIKAGFTLNYDNQPAEGASETDYVLQTGFGWEL